MHYDARRALVWSTVTVISAAVFIGLWMLSFYLLGRGLPWWGWVLYTPPFSVLLGVSYGVSMMGFLEARDAWTWYREAGDQHE